VREGRQQFVAVMAKRRCCELVRIVHKVVNVSPDPREHVDNPVNRAGLLDHFQELVNGDHSLNPRRPNVRRIPVRLPN